MNASNGSADFETARLRMRVLSEADNALFCDLYCDAETMRYIGPPLERARAERSFRKTLASWCDDPLQRAFFSATDKALDTAVGLCAVTRFATDRARAEVGIMLLPGACGRGFAREGLDALAREAFVRFALDEIWVECSAKNPVVERMVASIGFTLSHTGHDGIGSLAQREWTLRRPGSIHCEAFTRSESPALVQQLHA